MMTIPSAIVIALLAAGAYFLSTNPNVPTWLAWASWISFMFSTLWIIFFVNPMVKRAGR